MGRRARTSLCSRGPVWLPARPAADKAAVYAQLRKTMLLKGLRLVLMTPEEPRGDTLGLSPWRRVMTGYATVVHDLRQSREALRAGLDTHNLLLWQTMEELALRGIQQLDPGGVNTARSAGGEVRQLAGTYL